MATYIPNATQTTEPVESRTVESAALEFRTLKTSITARIEDVQDGLDTEIVNRIAGDANLQTQNNAQDVRLTVIENALPFIGEGVVPGTVYVQRFSGTGVQTAFTLDVVPQSGNVVDIYINGLYQNKDTFSVAGAVITFSAAPPAGTDNIEVQVTVTIALGGTDASLVSFLPADTSAVATNVQSKLREFVSVKDFGAVGDGVTDDTAAIQAADDYAYSVGAELHFNSGATYSASELFIKSARVFGHGAKLLKSSTTSQGFLNWGQKPSTMENGLLSDLIIDGGSTDNVINLRIYGNHEKSKIRNVTLLNSDFYAVAVGGLSGHGDKSDSVNGLDIDGIRIESTRGNTALVTDYSFGLELFPGVTCNDWKIRNVHTVGKILNKIHSVDGLDIDFCTFEVPVGFDPQASGYFEINNCDNLSLGKNNKSVYTSDTYYSLLIGNTRVVGGLGVNNARVSGEWGRVAFAGADSIYTDSAFKCRRLDLYSTVTKATLRGTLGAIYGIADSTLTRCDVIAAEVGAIYFTDATFTLGTIVFNGITQTRDTAYLLPIRFLCAGNIAFSNCALDAGMHNEAYGFQYNQAGGKVQLTNCRISGGGTTDRYFLFSNSPNTSAVGCNFENMNAATLYASGSQTLTTSRYNVLNGTAL